MLFFLQIIKNHGWQGFKEIIKLKLGKVSYLRFKDHYFERIYLKGFKQPILLRSNTTDYSTFKQIFHQCDYDIKFDFLPNFIIDAGANIGLASIYFSKHYPKAQIFAIEPESSNYERLLETVRSYSRILPIKAALHHTSDKTLEIYDKGIGHWGFATRHKNGMNANQTKHNIKTVSVTSLIEAYDIEIIDILKIDIEGAEDEVFNRDFNVWLTKVRCVIIEFHERFKPGSEERIKSLLKNAGFSFY